MVLKPGEYGGNIALLGVVGLRVLFVAADLLRLGFGLLDGPVIEERILDQVDCLLRLVIQE